MSLPQHPEELRGLRAARWTRESTPGQFDRYGPEAQAELQARAIVRLGLVDTGLAWLAAHSGRTVYRSLEMASMLDAARLHEFDVLLVGYVSRWQRNLRQTLNLLEDHLHAAGVAVYFCDEEILSSCERHWDQLVEEAKDAERYSRRLQRRIHEGYASKLAIQRDPGGHAPFGFRRNEAKLIEPDPSAVPKVQRIYALSAAGRSDREVAADVGLGLYVVRGVLTSPLYVGHLRDGHQAHWAPLVDIATYNRAQAVRAARATTAGRPASPKRPYALSMLCCAACGRRLIGDTGYYRHRDVCPDFAAATPNWPANWRGRRDGKGYPRPLYESVIGQVLAHVALGAQTLTQVVGLVTTPPPSDDRFALARIKRERDRALDQYLRDRDATALERTMSRLDQEETEAKRPRATEGVPAELAVQYLRELATTWQRAAGGPGRRLLAEALFERIDATGFREATLRLTDTAIAHGFAAVIPERLQLSVGYGRGERI